jgi:serine/threonine protein kinase
MPNTDESGQICSDTYINWEGEILNNRYIALKKIGYGSAASVWVAYDNQLNNCTAIKIFNIDDYVGGEYEVTLLKRINKLKNDFGIKFIESFDHETDNGTHLCVVLELLKDSLYNYRKHNELSLLDIKTITKQVLLFLIDINKNGLVHTDIKPENILVCDENDISKKVNELVKSSNFSTKLLNKKKELLKNKKTDIKKVGNLALKELLLNELKLNNNDSSQNSDDDENSTDSYSSSVNFNNNNYYMSKNLLEESSDSDDEKQTENKSTDKSNNFNIFTNEQKIKKIKVSDFNTCQDINKPDFEIQTRYYRAPEVILENHFSEKIDVWSLGCTLYELLTRVILINPDDYKEVCEDRYHMYLIQSKIKSIDLDFINKSKKKYIFIDSNNLLKGFREFKAEPFWKELITKYGESPQLYDFIDFLNECLEPNPELRKTPINLLEHSFLQ